MLLLVAVAQGCVSMIDSQMKEALKNSFMPREMIILFESVAKPLFQLKGQNWSSRELDEKTKTASPPLTKAKTRIPVKVVESNQYFELQFCPNVLSLFLETRVIPDLYEVVLMSPHVNHRSLHFDRVWKINVLRTNKDDKNPGIIATMLNVGGNEIFRDKSLSTSNYYLFPYKIKERTPNDNSSAAVNLAFSEPVFSNRKMYLSDATRVVVHITEDDVRQLLEVLSPKVCSLAYVVPLG